MRKIYKNKKKRLMKKIKLKMDKKVLKKIVTQMEIKKKTNKKKKVPKIPLINKTGYRLWKKVEKKEKPT